MRFFILISLSFLAASCRTENPVNRSTVNNNSAVNMNKSVNSASQPAGKLPEYAFATVVSCKNVSSVARNTLERAFEIKFA